MKEKKNCGKKVKKKKKNGHRDQYFHTIVYIRVRIIIKQQ